MRKDIERRLQLCQSLPTLPAVAMEVLRLCQQEEFDMSELAKIIGKDPALTAKILKVANSPLFNLRREVTKVSQAIVWLGVQSVRTLALSFSLVRGLRKPSQGGFDQDRYWKRSIIAAVAARELAGRAELRSWEEAFLAALLQDIGMMALRQAASDEYDALLVEAGDDHLRLVELERAAFGCDHAEVGAWMARKWRLPEVLTSSVALSHADSFEEVTGDVQSVTRCVALAGWMADIWVMEDTAQATANARRYSEAIFGMDQAMMEETFEIISEKIPEVSALFDVRLGSPQDIACILDQAREALILLNLQNVQRARQAELAVSRLEQRTRQLEESTMRDDLTGLYGRKRLSQFVEHEFERADYLQAPVSALFVDIDFFKSVNDTYGHQAGDQVLSCVARLLQGEVRPSDLVSRYGGEEFVMVLPGVDATQAHRVAERVRFRIESTPCLLPCGTYLRVTASVGVATHAEQTRFENPDALLHAADVALYSAKNGGRNCVKSHAVAVNHGLHLCSA